MQDNLESLDQLVSQALASVSATSNCSNTWASVIAVHIAQKDAV